MPGCEAEATPPGEQEEAAEAGFEIADEAETGPCRRCIATGTVRPREELLRFVVSPEGEVVCDLDHRLPGRGIWLSPRRDVVNTAVAKRLFARAARRAVTVPPDLPARIETALTRRCLDVIGLARRAGQAVCGFDKVCAEIRAGRVALILAAADAAAEGRDKVRALASGRAAERNVPVIDLFDSAALGGVFGRDRTVHVCLAPGRLAGRLVADAALLAEVRSEGDAGNPGGNRSPSAGGGAGPSGDG